MCTGEQHFMWEMSRHNCGSDFVPLPTLSCSLTHVQCVPANCGVDGMRRIASFGCIFTIPQRRTWCEHGLCVWVNVKL